MNEDQYRKLREKLLNQIKSLDETWKLYQSEYGDTGSTLEISAPRSSSSNKHPKNEVQAIRVVIEGLKKKFTKNDVSKLVPKTFPEYNPKMPYINVVLKRFERDGAIKVIKRGGGQRATIYLKS